MPPRRRLHYDVSARPVSASQPHPHPPSPSPSTTAAPPVVPPIVLARMSSCGLPVAVAVGGGRGALFQRRRVSRGARKTTLAGFAPLFRCRIFFLRQKGERPALDVETSDTDIRRRGVPVSVQPDAQADAQRDRDDDDEDDDQRRDHADRPPPKAARPPPCRLRRGRPLLLED